MRTAFKEWAVIADALLQGEQILIFRKGGISEGKGGFKVQHEEFLLFPTLFHQQRESVIDSARARYDLLSPNFPPPGVLRIEGFAQVTGWRRLESLHIAEQLRGQHVWRDEVIAERFDWGKSKEIYVMALRVFRLGKIVEIPMISSYGGCKSWVELENDVDVEAAEAVLEEGEFREKYERFVGALEGVAK